jgi:TatD DNase family protein
VPPQPKPGKYVDCGCAVLSRQFDRDRDRVLQRADTDGATVLVTWFSDVEKQGTLHDFCKASSGQCYFVCGVHPDNIDRTNKKSHESWLEKVEDLARKPECVAILGGLNLTREMGTHFPQETMLRSACSVADKVVLPLVLHCTDAASLARALEVLREEDWVAGEAADDEDGDVGHRRVIVHDGVTSCGGDVSVLQNAITAGCYFTVSGVGVTESDANPTARASECIAAIPKDRILSCSDSPWRTPQNIPDTYLRTLRNEPCNVLFVNEAIATAIRVDIEATNTLLRANALRAFGLEFASNEVAEAASGISNVSLSTTTAPQNVAPVSAAVTTNEASVTAAPATANSTEALSVRDGGGHYYCCHKCRTKLFNHSSLTHHASEATRTVFRAGQEEGVCKDVLFVPTSAEQLGANNVSMGVVMGKSQTAECKVCGVKVGKFCPGECVCTCGASVTGPVLRILTTKVPNCVKSFKSFLTLEFSPLLACARLTLSTLRLLKSSCRVWLAMKPSHLNN